MRYANCQKKKICFHTPLLVTVSIFLWPYLALRLIYEVLAEIFHILCLKLKFYLNQNENQNKFKESNLNGKKIKIGIYKQLKKIEWLQIEIIDIHLVLNLPCNLHLLQFGTQG